MNIKKKCFIQVPMILFLVYFEIFSWKTMASPSELLVIVNILKKQDYLIKIILMPILVLFIFL